MNRFAHLTRPAVWLLFLAPLLIACDSRVTLGPGEMVREVPKQRALTNEPPFTHLDVYTLTPVAEYSLEAKVLSRKWYSTWVESAAELAPLDLAVGWGIMSDEDMISRLEISQGDRFYYWSTRDPEVPLREVERSSANMHLIPSDGFVESAMYEARPGDLVWMRGFLVNVTREDGYYWNTSTTRGDTGPGACEILYVQEFQITTP